MCYLVYVSKCLNAMYNSSTMLLHIDAKLKKTSSKEFKLPHHLVIHSKSVTVQQTATCFGK